MPAMCIYVAALWVGPNAESLHLCGLVKTGDISLSDYNSSIVEIALVTLVQQLQLEQSVFFLVFFSVNLMG